MVLLAKAVKTIPIGTAYPVWTGIGAVGTVLLGILVFKEPATFWWHMFGWNTFGVLLMGPAVATWRFFDTLNKVERRLQSPLKKSTTSRTTTSR